MQILILNGSKFQCIMTDVDTIKNGSSAILFGYSTNICIKCNNMCTDVRTQIRYRVIHILYSTNSSKARRLLNLKKGWMSMWLLFCTYLLWYPGWIAYVICLFARTHCETLKIGAYESLHTFYYIVPLLVCYNRRFLWMFWVLRDCNYVSLHLFKGITW